MRSRTPDRLCAEAVDLARKAAEEVAHPGMVGEHLEAVAEGARVVTHFFACREPGYRGWRWAVTVARAARARVVTVDETALLPGPDALLAPAWVPWSERLRPGDLGPGDLLPAEPDDPRLAPGYTTTEPEAVEAAVPSQGAADTGGRSGRRAGGAGGDEGAAAGGAEESGEPGEAAEPARDQYAPGQIAAIARELGRGRRRVLSRHGLQLAAERWDASHGPNTAMAQAAPAECATCGFLLPLAGAARQAFGVCANEYSPADGHVVSLSYGCGAHSEAAVSPAPVRPAPAVIDETQIDELPLGEPAP